MRLYATQTELAEMFGLSIQTVYRRVKGIRKEISNGRYSRYAVADRLVNKEVFLDYAKYWKRLEDKNLRKTVPPFDQQEARSMITEGRR